MAIDPMTATPADILEARAQLLERKASDCETHVREMAEDVVREIAAAQEYRATAAAHRAAIAKLLPPTE